ncbi:MAG: CGNR zinc finger domain-containing protein [Planctomycetota bacterium]|jgi:predicted RNA-binding Zn ribbon-like protein
MDAIWIDFLNSDWHDHLGRGSEDRLESAAWLRGFRARWDLPAFDAGQAGARARLRRLRSAIQGALDALRKGKRIPQRDLETINACLTSEPVAQRLVAADGGYRLEVARAGRGLGAVLREIAASFAGFVVDQDVQRVKICENPDCGWVFLDTTRSRTRRWCGSECGNLLRVRRFRDQG